MAAKSAHPTEVGFHFQQLPPLDTYVIVPVSQTLCICHKGAAVGLQLTVPIINDALHILALLEA